MAEYIERESLLKEVESRIMWSLPYIAICEAIQIAPTADVVEVVRCKDCTEFHFAEGCAPSYCVMTGCEVGGEDFCSYGERRNDG